MTMKSKYRKYSLGEIHEGMKIADKSQLSNIYDTWIILVKQSDLQDYTIGFIGKETNACSDNLFKEGFIVCPVYNDSIELEEGIFFEESQIPS